jgi:hypothetical protein
MMTRRDTALLLASLGLYIAACGVVLHLKIVPDQGDFDTEKYGFASKFDVGTEAVTMTLTNLSDEPIEVLWHKTTLVDTEGNALDVMHGGGRTTIAAKNIGGADVSRIPPGAKLTELVVPKNRVEFSGGNGWIAAPFIEVECGPVRCTGLDGLAGKYARLNATLRLKGEERTFDWRFRIAEAFYTTTRDRQRGTLLRNPIWSRHPTPTEPLPFAAGS